jgi:hypothetical protein
VASRRPLVVLHLNNDLRPNPRDGDLSQSLRFGRDWISFQEILRQRNDDDGFQGQPVRARHHPLGVRWYVAYPISYRQLEEMMQERGVEVDHSSLNRWVRKYIPVLDQVFRQRKRPVGASWRMDGTYISVKGQWKYWYRTVDKAGHTVDFLLTAKRDRKAAARFLRKAIDQCGTPEKITIDRVAPTPRR